MHSFHKRARMARLALGLVALAVPFVAVGGAQAAIGQSTPVSTTGPDLVSATIAPGNAVNICFDQEIDLQVVGVTDIAVGGYADVGVGNGFDFFSGTPVIISDNCIQAQFDTGFLGTDLTTATIASVQYDVVKNQLNQESNLADSTPLIGSTTHNGTRGYTTGPDLTTAIVDGPQNQINYVFDQDINNCSAVGTGWRFYGNDGVEHNSASVLGCSGNIARVQFSNSDTVTIAQRVSVSDGRVDSAGPSDSFNNLASAIVPGKTGTSTAPDLVSNELVSPTGRQIAFEFDENIKNIDATEFEAIGSDGNTYNGVSENLVNGNTAVVSFPVQTELQSEFLVRAAARFNAVESQDDGQSSPRTGLPAGDNAGAFAQGYTMGPDALSASVNQSLGQVTVTMDQRVVSFGGTIPALLVNPDGTLGSSSSATNFGTLGAPGPSDVTYNFAQSDLANAVGIFLPGPLYSGGSGTVESTRGYPNAQQIFSIR